VFRFGFRFRFRVPSSGLGYGRSPINLPIESTALTRSAPTRSGCLDRYILARHAQLSVFFFGCTLGWSISCEQLGSWISRGWRCAGYLPSLPVLPLDFFLFSLPVLPLDFFPLGLLPPLVCDMMCVCVCVCVCARARVPNHCVRGIHMCTPGDK
jgi:hypothetical protein